MEITNENYYSQEVNKNYMSVSQFKSFAGTNAKIACESKALHDYLYPTYEPTTSLLVGSYVDAYYEGTLDEFKANHPEIISSRGATKGELKAEFKQADAIIERTKQDPLFQAYTSGEKQKMMTGNLFGVDWKIKPDFLFDDKITDLKIVESIQKVFWANGEPYDFIRYWGYDIQGAVYQAIVEQNTGKKLPFYIVAASKEKGAPDIEIIEIDQSYLDEALEFVKLKLPHVLAVKNQTETPARCGVCAHCRATKKLIAPIKLSDFNGERRTPMETIEAEADNPFAD
jgi:hypothetical protein